MPSKPPSRLIAARIPESAAPEYPRLVRDEEAAESIPSLRWAFSTPRRAGATSPRRPADVEQPERWDGLS